MAENTEIKVGVDTKGAQDNVKKLKDKTGDLKDTLDDLTGGAISGFEKFGKGIKSLSGGFKGLKGAIAATGIGALVTLVVGATEYFMNFEGGVKLVEQAMAALGGVMGKLGETFQNLIQGNFRQAAKSFTEIKDAAIDSAQAVERQFEAERKLFNLRKENIVVNEELRQSIENERKVLEDTTLAADKRLESLDKITAMNKQLQENIIEETRLQKESIEQQLQVENNYEKRRELELELSNIQAELIRQQGDLNRINYDAGKLEREILQQVREKKNADLEKERTEKERILELDRLLQEQFEEDLLKQQEESEKELEVMRAKEQAELDLLKSFEEQKFDLLEEEVNANQMAEDAIDKATRQRIENEKAYEQQKTQFSLSQTSMLLGAMGQFAKQGSKLQKSLAMGSVLADSAAAAIGIFKSSTSLPEPAATANRIVQLGVLAAATTKSIRDIKNSDQGAGSVPAVGGGAASFNVNQAQEQTGTPQLLTPDQVASTIGGNVIRSYVLNGDINNSMDAENKLNNLSTI